MFVAETLGLIKTDTGLDGDTQQDHPPCDSLADQPSTISDSYGGQDTMVTAYQQQLQDVDGTQHQTLSQNTSVGAISSDKIEDFEDDDSW